MRLWVDDLREAPVGYIWVRSVNEAKHCILSCEKQGIEIELIDIDHDAGVYASDGGDYIRLLDWLEFTGRCYPIRIHSMNSVGVQNMRAIIEHAGWMEVR